MTHDINDKYYNIIIAARARYTVDAKQRNMIDKCILYTLKFLRIEYDVQYTPTSDMNVVINLITDFFMFGECSFVVDDYKRRHILRPEALIMICHPIQDNIPGNVSFEYYINHCHTIPLDNIVYYNNQRQAGIRGVPFSHDSYGVLTSDIDLLACHVYNQVLTSQ